MIDVEKKFFAYFGVGTPTIKCVEWDNDEFSHSDDWSYRNRTFNELGIKLTIEELNARIKECKNNDPKNIKHDGYCFANGCFVEAFMQYPHITTDILFELMRVLVINGYTVEIFNMLNDQGIAEYVVNLVKEPSRYHSHSEDLTDAILKSIMLLNDDENIVVEVRSLFSNDDCESDFRDKPISAYIPFLDECFGYKNHEA